MRTKDILLALAVFAFMYALAPPVASFVGPHSFFAETAAPPADDSDSGVCDDEDEPCLA